jgi:hypothetical protein
LAGMAAGSIYPRFAENRVVEALAHSPSDFV